MSNHPRGPLDLSHEALRLFRTGVTAIQVALELDIVGIIVDDEDGVAIIPRPGCDRELIELLENASWTEAKRTVEEHRA